MKTRKLSSEKPNPIAQLKSTHHWDYMGQLVIKTLRVECWQTPCRIFWQLGTGSFVWCFSTSPGEGSPQPNNWQIPQASTFGVRVDQSSEGSQFSRKASLCSYYGDLCWESPDSFVSRLLKSWCFLSLLNTDMHDSLTLLGNETLELYIQSWD